MDYELRVAEVAVALPLERLAGSTAERPGCSFCPERRDEVVERPVFVQPGDVREVLPIHEEVEPPFTSTARTYTGEQGRVPLRHHHPGSITPSRDRQQTSAT
ncbi:MAG TPA: hypothetical protein VGK17_03635 [Propionicimonas sp.]